MKRLSATVGLIVPSIGFVKAIEVGRTQTYGRTWIMAQFKRRLMSNGSIAPKVQTGAKGTILISAYVQRFDGAGNL